MQAKNGILGPLFLELGQPGPRHGVAPGPTRLDSTRSHAGPPGPCEGAQADLRQQPGRGSSEAAHDTAHAPLGSLGQPLADDRFFHWRSRRPPRPRGARRAPKAPGWRRRSAKRPPSRSRRRSATSSSASSRRSTAPRLRGSRWPSWWARARMRRTSARSSRRRGVATWCSNDVQIRVGSRSVPACRTVKVAG